MAKAFISGCAGTVLTSDELSFFQTECPWGLILFARNCAEPSQIKDLVAAFRDAVRRDNAPVLIDQEGGRVQRLKAPHWPAYPSGSQLADAYELNPEAGLSLARNIARLIADDLLDLGINVDCLPVLDVPQPGGHDVIGNRAYGSTPAEISAIGRVMSEGLMERGVLPVIKHIPGHGRATADSHLALPVVSASRDELRRSDFPPFADLSDMPLAMTAHIVYEAFDKANPATLSEVVIGDVIRGEIGFDGLLMTDDLSMKALGGNYGERTRRSLAAGCDVVLHCNGQFDEMKAVANATPKLIGESAKRAARAIQHVGEPAAYDRDLALADLKGLMARSA